MRDDSKKEIHFLSSYSYLTRNPKTYRLKTNSNYWTHESEAWQFVLGSVRQLAYVSQEQHNRDESYWYFCRQLLGWIVAVSSEMAQQRWLLSAPHGVTSSATLLGACPFDSGAGSQKERRKFTMTLEAQTRASVDSNFWCKVLFGVEAIFYRSVHEDRMPRTKH